MAGPRVRPPSLFYGNGGARVGELQDIQYVLTSGDGHEVCDADTFFTDGREMGKITATLLAPNAGISGIDLVNDLKAHKDVTVRLGVVLGKIHKCAARIQQIELSGKFSDGVTTCKVEFTTKSPQVTA